MRMHMKLKMAFHQNPRILPLVDGTVPLDGYEMDWHVGHAAQLHQWHLQENAWVNGRTAEHTHGEGTTDSLATGVELRRLQPGERLNDLLQRGEIDGAYGDSASANVEPSDKVRLLPLAIGRQTFRDYYAKT